MLYSFISFNLLSGIKECFCPQSKEWLKKITAPIIDEKLCKFEFYRNEICCQTTPQYQSKLPSRPAG